MSSKTHQKKDGRGAKPDHWKVINILGTIFVVLIAILLVWAIARGVRPPARRVAPPRTSGSPLARTRFA